MVKGIKYTCSCCGKEYEEWPALTYTSPTNYDTLPDEDKQKFGELRSDFCIIRHSDQTERYIRCTLTQKVIDHCENMEYGLWVSLSEKSFQDYSVNYLNENHETKYFGWLSNDYPATNSAKAFQQRYLQGRENKDLRLFLTTTLIIRLFKTIITE